MKKTIFLLILCIICIQPMKPLHLGKYQSKNIRVEIKGEVHAPGVYTLDRGSTISSVIDKAKGINGDADISNINLNKELYNKDVIVIGKKLEVSKVSLNAANEEEFCTLPGIGSSTAQKIIAYRQEYGSFQSIEEIMKIKGIKEKLFSKIKEMISL